MLVLEVVGVLEDGSEPRAAGVPINPRKALSVPLGADWTLRVSVVTPFGSQVQLTSGALVVTVKKKPTDSSAAFFRAATNGVFVFTPADTKNLPPGQYVYDIWYTDTGNKRSPVVPLSPFLLEASATLPT